MLTFIIHYHELALKKRNREFFVNKLVENIRFALRDFEGVEVEKLFGRLLLYVNKADKKELSVIVENASNIPGIANVMPVFECGLDMEELKKAAGKKIAEMDFLGKTFRVETKRANKEFELTSEDINRELGAFVVEKTGAKVNLEKPDITLYVEVVNDKIFFGFEKIKGYGGLPVGSSGKLVSLLSGGIDSPAASFMMMKRGCKCVFAHFHSYPYLDYSSQEKAIELVKILNNFQQKSKLYMLPFGDAQKEVVLKAPEKYRVIIYRRLMIRIAERIAAKEKAKGLLTGESLGQVASQTLENMSVINNVASVPIMRPLVGMNKEEVIDIAQKIGTYETSIVADQDCCQLFMPKNPETKAVLEDVEKMEQELDIEALVSDVIERGEVKVV